MKVLRHGVERFDGNPPISATLDGFDIEVATRRPLPTERRGAVKQVINVTLAVDTDKSGGGNHIHTVQIEMLDFARIVAAVSDAVASGDDATAKELQEHFAGNITSLERLKLAVLGMR